MKTNTWQATIIKWITFAGVAFLIAAAIQVIGTKQSSAMFNRGEYSGYFTGSYATSGDYVQPGGIGVGNANDFINWYKAKLNGSQQEKVMASFTIRTMMGEKVGSPNDRWSVPSGTVNEWESRVRDYAKKGLIDFNANYSFSKNTFYQEGSADIAWYPDSDTQPSIVFKHPNGKRYAIKRSCANPVGEIDPLQKLDPDWELKTPVSQVSTTGNGGWTKTIYAKAGDTVYFRHQIGNKGPDTAENFDTWREYNNKPNSDGTKQTLGANDERWIGSTDPEGRVPVPVPGNAKEGDSVCQRQAVNPARYGGNGTLRATYACVIVKANPPSTGGLPDFGLNADCRTGIHITNLGHPNPNQDRNVATRVRVYPNNQGSGIVIDQNGNAQGDGSFVFRTRGNVDIPWPSGYGNITWRVDVRAFELNHVNENDRSVLQSNYIVSPCWELTPGTNPVPGFIEQGGAVGFNHFVTNSTEKTAENINTCVITNYNIYNPNGGNTGEYCSTNLIHSFGGGTTGPPLPNNSPAVYTDGSTPLGATYCQRYRIDPVSELSGGARESGNACTKIVGGKTYLSVQPPSEKYVEPGDTGRIQAGTITQSYTDAPGYGGYGITCRYTVTFARPNGAIQKPVDNASCDHTINSNNPQNVVNYPYTPGAGDIGTKICVETSIAPANGNWNLIAAGYPASGKACFDVVAKPYMKVMGGDIAAGSCGSGDSMIAGWNKLSKTQGAGGDGNLGAGARYAAFAQGKILSFASGQDVAREANHGYSPTNLSFANEATNPSAGNFGGGFTGTPCITNYSGTKPGNPSDISPWPGITNAAATLGAKTYAIDSPSVPTTIGSATIPSNVSMRIYVKGDVILSGNIVANYSGAMDASQMPNFTLIVDGNIYVQPGVSQLYGTYVAEGSKGNIYTCSSGTNPINSAKYTAVPPVIAGNPYAVCGGTQLTFTGSVVAQQIHLLRTFGSLYEDTSPVTGQARAGEVFKYNPLSWVYAVVGPTTGGVDTYDSMSTLPPTL